MILLVSCSMQMTLSCLQIMKKSYKICQTLLTSDVYLTICLLMPQRAMLCTLDLIRFLELLGDLQVVNQTFKSFININILDGLE